MFAMGVAPGYRPAGIGREHDFGRREHRGRGILMQIIQPAQIGEPRISRRLIPHLLRQRADGLAQPLRAVVEMRKQPAFVGIFLEFVAHGLVAAGIVRARWNRISASPAPWSAMCGCRKYTAPAAPTGSAPARSVRTHRCRTRRTTRASGHWISWCTTTRSTPFAGRASNVIRPLCCRLKSRCPVARLRVCHTDRSDRTARPAARPA